MEGALWVLALDFYVSSQSPPPSQISGRPLQLQEPGHSKWRLHTWSKAAVMSLPAFPDVGSSYDDRYSPWAFPSMLSVKGEPSRVLARDTPPLKVQIGRAECLLVYQLAI